MSHKGAEPLGKMNEWLNQELSHFLTKLQQTPEADGNLLDRTIVFYGSGNAYAHGTTNYPIVLAGGRKIGLRHGQYLKFTQATPLTNLFTSMLHCIDVPAESFGDSTGEMSEVLA